MREAGRRLLSRGVSRLVRVSRKTKPKRVIPNRHPLHTGSGKPNTSSYSRLFRRRLQSSRRRWLRAASVMLGTGVAGYTLSQIAQASDDLPESEFGFETDAPVWQHDQSDDDQTLVLSETSTIQDKESTNTPSNQSAGEDRLVIKNLVFQGGGPKGTAYVGALKELEEQEYLDGIERVAGASAGAITAALLAVGYTPDKIEQLVDEKNFTDFLREDDWTDWYLLLMLNALSFMTKSKIAAAGSVGVAGIGGWLLQTKLTQLVKKVGRVGAGALAVGGLALAGTVPLMYRLYQYGGLSTGESFRIWFDEIIARKIAEIKTGNPENYRDHQHCTFGELHQLIKENPSNHQLRDLYVAIVHFPRKPNQAGTGEAKVICYSTDLEHQSDMTNVIISDAVRSSMAIPFVFREHGKYVKKNGKRTCDKATTHIDGGVNYNYPVDLFDKNRCLSKALRRADLVPNTYVYNLETLGLTLFDIHDVGFFEKIYKVCNALKSRGDKVQVETDKHPVRDIFIDVCGVGLLDFNLTAEEKEIIIESGRSSAERFIHDHALALKDAQAHGCVAAKNAECKIMEQMKSMTSLPLWNDREYVDTVPDEYFKTDERGVSLQRLAMDPTNADSNMAAIRYVAITGFGGVGKSALSRHFAHEYLTQYFWQKIWKDAKTKDDLINPENRPVIFWLQVVKDQDIYLHYYTFAKQLGATDQELEFFRNCRKEQMAQSEEADGLDAIRRFITRRLHTHPHRLILIDNADELSVAKTLIDQFDFGEGEGRIIVTSRNDQVLGAKNHATCLKISLCGLSEEKSLRLLTRGNSPEEAKQQTAAEEIVSRCGRLPHLLLMARAKMNESLDIHSNDYVAYRDQLDESEGALKALDLPKLAKSELKDYSLTQQAVLFDAIQPFIAPDSPAHLKAILWYISYLLPNAITTEALRNFLRYFQYKADEMTEADNIRLEEILTEDRNAILRVSFIQVASGPGEYSTHSIVQAFVRSILSKMQSISDRADFYTALLCSIKDCTNLKNDDSFYEIWRKIRSIEYAYQILKDEPGLNNYTLLSGILLNLARLFSEIREEKVSIEICEALLTPMINFHGENSLKLLPLLVRMGADYTELNKKELAIKHAEYASNIAKTNKGEGSQEYAASLIVLANAYMGTDNEIAKSIFLSAMHILQMSDYVDEIDFTILKLRYAEISLNNQEISEGMKVMKSYLRPSANYDKGNQILAAKALALYGRRNFFDLTAQPKEEGVDTFKQLSEYTTLFTTARSVLVERYGERYIDVASLSALLGYAYYCTGQTKSALSELNRALRVFQQIDQDKLTAGTHLMIGLCEMKLENYLLAITHWKNAHTIFCNVFGKDHDNTLTIGRIIEKFDEAIRLSQNIIGIRYHSEERRDHYDSPLSNKLSETARPDSDAEVDASDKNEAAKTP